MAVVKPVLSALAKKTGLIVAALIIVAAILVSLGSLLTPLLDNHRADFERWTSQLLGTPVTINKVRVSWYLYQPEISLQQVTLLKKNSNEPLLQIKNVRVFFSIPQSLWQRKWVTSGIMIAGADINVHQAASGELEVQGFPSLGGFNNPPYKSESKLTDALGFLSQENRLILRDIDVRYTNTKNEKYFVTLYNLTCVNTANQHSILGKAILHQDIPTEMTVAVQWMGTVLDFATIRAKIYVYVSGFSLTQWLNHFSWQGFQVKQGIASAKVWAIWKQGGLQRVQSTLQLYDLHLFSARDQSTHRITRFSGNVGWKRDGGNQVLAGEDILIDLPQHLWPATRFYLSYGVDASGAWSPKVLTLGYVDMADVQPFIFSAPAFLSTATQQIISSLQVKGQLQEMSATFASPWTDWRHLALNANVMQLQFASWHQLPSVKNLSGKMRWNAMHGNLTLTSQRSVFDYPAVFTRPITIDQLSGEMSLQQNAKQAWVLTVPTLQILNDDLAANITGTLTLPQQGSPIADMQAHFTLQNAKHLIRYLPMATFDKDLVAWLQQAILSGEVNGGVATLRGPLADFPFNEADQSKGLFSISGMARDIDLNFAPHWPTLKKMNGKILFIGRRMEVDIDKAQLLDIPLSHIKGIIPYLGDAKPQLLEVDSDTIKADFMQVTRLLHQSPLEKFFGKMLSEMTLKGPMSLQLKLTMPLKNPDNTAVVGGITMQDATLLLPLSQLRIGHLRGRLSFTENSVTAERIAGELFGEPLQLSFDTVQQKNVSIIQAHFATQLAIRDIEQWLHLSLAKIASGRTAVMGQLNLSRVAPLSLQLHSDLAGVALQLPDGYSKNAAEKKAFSADIVIAEKAPLRLTLVYADALSAALILNHQQQQWNILSANLHFGKGTVNFPSAPGLYITGNIEELNWDKIKTYLNPNNRTQLSNLNLRGIDVVAQTVQVGAERLNAVRLQVAALTDVWDVHIASNDIAGQIKVPKKITAAGLITAQFQRFVLRSTSKTAEMATSIDIRSLPVISFVANNVAYNALSLGQVTFKTRPSANGLNILMLNIISPRLNLHATGDWNQTGKQGITHLQGNATTIHLTDLLVGFGLDVKNFEASNGRLTFNLNWSGAPYAPKISLLNGRATLDVERGRIVDIGKENGAKMDLGRMLSIFSLQTIPRRLTLDFSDLFQKGYSFDSVRGDFNLRNGDVFTNNMRFDGPVAKVGIDGRIGLNKKDYHFTLSVTPNVTSTLPIAATLISAGNPIVGAAAFAVSSLIGSQVNKVATYYYTVTGPWNNPSWKPMNSAPHR